MLVGKAGPWDGDAQWGCTRVEGEVSRGPLPHLQPRGIFNFQLKACDSLQGGL